MLTLSILGPVLLGDKPLPDHLTTRLLVLLGTHPAGLSRVRVAAQIWPALAPEAAGRNLRKTLHRLRADGLAGLLMEWPGTLRLFVPCDYARATYALAKGTAGAAADALALHRGPLADGLRDDAGWLAPARVSALTLWRRTLLAALPALPAFRAEGELLRLRAIDPHDESLARAHLALLADRGCADEHARVRAAWVRALADDLGVVMPPDPPAPAASVPPPLAARGAATLVGRDDELALLRERLAEPGAWIAVCGPGGIGKTRLAAAAAEHAAADGLAVWWWPLADAPTLEAAWARLAVELGQDDARPAALAAALSARPALLVADNVEHLLAAGFAEGLAALRTAAPGLRGVCTSRGTVDDLPLMRLAALDVPDPADPPGAVLRSAAVRLFTERARAAHATFEPRAHADALGRIARAAGGHALALELAALRVRHAAPAEIAAALEAGAGGLEPLFEAAWATLPPALAAGLAALAALPPTFERALAEAAAALRPSDFDALVARSLVEPPVEGTRWRLHPLLRHWLRLNHPAPAASLHASAAVVAALGERLATAAHDHAATLAWAETEHELLAQAFRRAVAEADRGVLARLTPALGASMETRGRRTELQALLAEAASALADAPLAVRAPVQVQRAVVAYRSGRFDEALLLTAGLDRAPPAARVTAAGVSGLVAWQRGEGATARAVHERALKLALAHGLEYQVPVALNNLALVDMMDGRFGEAEQRLRQAAERAEACGSHRVLVLSRMNLGGALRSLGRAAAARSEVQAAWVAARTHGLVSLEINALLTLGATLLELGDLEALAPLVHEGRRLAVSGEASLAIGVHIMTMLFHVRRGEPAQCWPHAQEAWHASVTLSKATQQVELALRAAEAWAAEGRRSQALAWLAWQRRQPTQWKENRDEAERLWTRLAPDVDEAATAEAVAAALDLDALGRDIEAAARACGQPPGGAGAGPKTAA